MNANEGTQLELTLQGWSPLDMVFGGEVPEDEIEKLFEVKMIACARERKVKPK